MKTTEYSQQELDEIVRLVKLKYDFSQDGCMISYRYGKDAALRPRAMINVYAEKGNIIRYRLNVHRIMFLIYNGYLPELVDHIDGSPTNNKKSNLRAATKLQNCRNRRINTNNTTGFKGVTRDRNTFAAAISGKYLGNYKTAEAAYAAYCAAAKDLHGEFANYG